MVAPNVCESSVWNLLNVRVLALRTLKVAPNFFFFAKGRSNAVGIATRPRTGRSGV